MDRWIKLLFLVFFLLVLIGDLISLIGFYLMGPAQRKLILNVLPPVYWGLKALEILVSGLYIFGIINSFNRKSMAGLAFIFTLLRLLSVGVLSGVETVITWRLLVQHSVFYVAGIITAYHLKEGM
ncbi:hypothetical protein [Thermococcus zilligii]|uniref:hypothetical protein n=1 Tax=Thermococcus zilligii TaxID=54076 RepID=UPI00029AB53C|nr:hypothetical protein [Thermococcus zilligii]